MAATKPVDWEKRLDKVDASRQAETILGWIASAKWPGASSASAWEAMFARLVSMNEPATVEPLRAMAKELPAFLGAKHRAWMTEQLDALAAKLAETSKGKPAGPPIVLKRPGASGDTMSIVQRVFDAPEDDDLRRVVADQLLEQGHPWGEFIQLGFLLDANTATPDQAAVCAKLAQKNATTFAGPLAKIAKVDSRQYHKGFLRRVVTDASMVPRPAWETAATTPYWSTVRHLEIDMTTTPKWWTAALMKNAAVRSLREVSFNRYHEPLISLAREGTSAPWRVTEAKTSADAWLRYFRDFVETLSPEERARIEVGDIANRDAIRTTIEDASE